MYACVYLYVQNHQNNHLNLKNDNKSGKRGYLINSSKFILHVSWADCINSRGRGNQWLSKSEISACGMDFLV